MSVILPTRTDQRIVYTDADFARVQIDLPRASTNARGALVGNACKLCGGVRGDYRVLSRAHNMLNGEGAFYCAQHAQNWLPRADAEMLEYIDPALCIIEGRNANAR